MNTKINKTARDAAFIFLVATLFSFVFSTYVSYTWDELPYILSGIKYIRWFKELAFLTITKESIINYWQITQEHPPFVKVWMGIFIEIFQEKIGLLNAARISISIIHGIFCTITFLFFSKIYSRKFSIIFLFIINTLPRFLGYSSICIMDYPIAIFWFLFAIFFYRVDKNLKYLIICIILFGMLNLTKFTGILAIIPAFIWAVIFKRKIILKRTPLIFITGILFIVLFWPWMYVSTTNKLKHYFWLNIGRAFEIDLNKDKMDFPTKKPASLVKVKYFGKIFNDTNKNKTPWHYPLIMVLITIPIPILIFSLIGLFANIRNKDDPLITISFVNLLFFILFFALPFIPKYAGVRNFLFVYPFVALLGTYGAMYIADNRNIKNNFKIMIFFMLIIGGLSSLYSSRELLINYYNINFSEKFNADAIGFHLSGVEGTINEETINYINSNLPQNSSISMHPVEPYIMMLYSNNSPFRKDIKVVNDSHNANYLIIFNQKEFWDAHDTKLFNTQAPLYSCIINKIKVHGLYKQN